MQPLLYYKILNNLRSFSHGVSKNSRKRQTEDRRNWGAQEDNIGHDAHSRSQSDLRIRLILLPGGDSHMTLLRRSSRWVSQ